MSELDTNTSYLDEAQKDEPTKRQEYFTSIKNFIISTFTSGINLMIWFVISLVIIYFCKISQANVLPSDINCYPYTYEKHFPKEIQTNIFTNSPFSKPRKSMKMTFDVEGSDFVNGTLKFFRDYKIDNDSSFLGRFFYSIIESLFMKNYSYYNYILTFVDAIPEFLLVLFGPYLGMAILGVNVFLNVFYFIWYWLSNLGWMWKKNASIYVTERGEVKYSGPPNWVNVRWSPVEKNSDGSPDWSKSEWGKCITGAILIYIFIWIIGGIVILGLILVVPIVMNLFILYTLFTYNMKLGDVDSTFPNLFQYFFRYNKLIIMLAFSYYIVKNAYYELGSTSAGFAVLTIFLIYYLKIIEMFTSVGVEDERTSPLSSIRQAKREACEKPIPQYEEPPPYVPTQALAQTPVSIPFALSSSSDEGPNEGADEAPVEEKKKSSWFGSKKTEPPADETTADETAPPEKKSSWFGSKKTEPPADGTAPVADGTAPEKKSSWFGSKKTEPPAAPVADGTAPVAPEKKSSWFGSKKTEPPADGTAPVADGSTAPEKKSSWFGSKKTTPPADGTAPVVDGTAAPEKKSMFSWGSKKTTPAPPVDGTPAQKGGYKYKQMVSDNLIRELKKFHKKYSTILV